MDQAPSLLGALANRSQGLQSDALSEGSRLAVVTARKKLLVSAHENRAQKTERERERGLRFWLRFAPQGGVGLVQKVSTWGAPVADETRQLVCVLASLPVRHRPRLLLRGRWVRHLLHFGLEGLRHRFLELLGDLGTSRLQCFKQRKGRERES